MSSPEIPVNNPISVQPAKKSRIRIITSCTECNRRKQKCNREWPCNHCLSRRVVHLCRYDGRSRSKLGAPRDGTQKLDNTADKGAFENAGSSPEREPEIQLSSLGLTEGETAGEGILEEIGSSNTVLGKLFHGNSHSQEEPSTPTELSSRTSTPRSRTEILKLIPSRQVVDFLIRHFLAEVNWLYEQIYPPTFLERYDKWWSQPDYQDEDDIQFAVLILRLCINSLQFLPHPKHPTEAIFDTPLDVLESRCKSSAAILDAYRPRKPSLLRVQQLSFHVATLINIGNTKESYHALGEAVKEAQEIHLFLEEAGSQLNEFDREARRRTFWYTFVWDRFYCTFLGRWPLIPDHYFDIQLPRETPWMKSPNTDVPSQFTDVILNIKLSQYMHSFMSAPAKKSERLDPIAVRAHAQKFKEDFIDKLPPAFRLEDPDTIWDRDVPCLPMKRAWIHIVVYGVIEGMHKGFIKPLTPLDKDNQPDESNSSVEGTHRTQLAAAHRKTLANACINALKSVVELHELMGGGSHRYFMLSISVIETSAVLGICLISDVSRRRQAVGSRSAEHAPSFDAELRDRCQEAFQKGVMLLDLLAVRSPLAKKGVVLLRKLKSRIQGEDRADMVRELSCANDAPCATQIQNYLEPVIQDSETSSNVLGFDGNPVIGQLPNVISGPVNMVHEEWDPTASFEMDYSWLLENNMFGNLEDLGMDFGEGPENVLEDFNGAYLNFNHSDRFNY